MRKKKKIVVCAMIWLLVLFMAVPWVSAQDQGAVQKFSRAELDQMLAPIALYPDSLLAQILMASTYPLEVVMADRWVKENKGLQGDLLNAELDEQDWDPSVKALVPFPQVLDMMSENLEWTEKLGDAFLEQQDAVMNEIQRLREKARAAGHLNNGKEQKVIVEDNTIVIVPVNPDVIYVPIYNPGIVFGPWWYPDYPPFWYYPPGYVIAGIVFSFPFFCVVGPSWHFAWGHWDWHHHRVYVNVDRHINVNRVHISPSHVRTERWHHEVSHRRGVLYLHQSNRERFGQTGRSGSVESRRAFRGFSPAPRISGEFPRTPPQTVPQNRGPSVSRAPHVTPRTTPQNRGPSVSRVPHVTPRTPPQNRRAGGFAQRRSEGHEGRTIFGSMGRGSDIRRQSERGFQSRRSISPRGGTGAAPHSSGATGEGHGGSGHGSEGHGGGGRHR
jgi:hypothetical protein